jgi:hypothetical protein
VLEGEVKLGGGKKKKEVRKKKEKKRERKERHYGSLLKGIVKNCDFGNKQLLTGKVSYLEGRTSFTCAVPSCLSYYR